VFLSSISSSSRSSSPPSKNFVPVSIFGSLNPNEFINTCVIKLPNVFLKSAALLKEQSQTKELEFDKDDELALDFVTSASNLRSHIFGISLQSKFEVKASAGNIIPAIATTNAIIAGMIVLEAIKILGNRLNECATTYLLRKPSNKKILMNVQLEKPNPNCFVCGNNYVSLKIDTNKNTFSNFITQMLINSFGFNEPNIDTGTKFFEGGDEDLDDEEIEIKKAQLPKKLVEVDIHHNSVITITDQSQNSTISISIVHTDEQEFPDTNINKFEIIGALETAKAPTEAPIQSKDKTFKDDDIIIVDTNPKDKINIDNNNKNSLIGKKRARRSDEFELEDNGSQLKKQKQEPSVEEKEESMVIEID